MLTMLRPGTVKFRQAIDWVPASNGGLFESGQGLSRGPCLWIFLSFKCIRCVATQTLHLLLNCQAANAVTRYHNVWNSLTHQSAWCHAADVMHLWKLVSFQKWTRSRSAKTKEKARVNTWMQCKIKPSTACTDSDTEHKNSDKHWLKSSKKWRYNTTVNRMSYTGKATPDIIIIIIIINIIKVTLSQKTVAGVVYECHWSHTDIYVFMLLKMAFQSSEIWPKHRSVIYHIYHVFYCSTNTRKFAKCAKR